MSLAAAHATAFYREVASARRVWTVRDAEGFPAPVTSDGRRAQPFWSSESRARRIVESVAAYAGMALVEIAWDVFRDKWLPGLRSDGILVGVNWSGESATGYDIEPDQVRANVEAHLGRA